MSGKKEPRTKKKKKKKKRAGVSQERSIARARTRHKCRRESYENGERG